MQRNGRILALSIALATGLAFLVPATASAQLSPISTGNILEGAPIFSPSALVLDRGGISVGGDFHYIMIDEGEFSGDDDADIDINAIQATGNVAFGVTDRIMVGANVPWGRISAEGGGEEDSQSGLLDIDVFALAQLFRTANGRTMVSGYLDAVLPTTDDGFFEFLFGPDIEVDRDPSYAVGAALTHQASRASLHGSASYYMGGDATLESGGLSFEAEGSDAVRVTGAALFGLADRVRADGEVLIDIPIDDDEADTETTLAGGLRYLATPNLFVDGGVTVPVSDSFITAGLLLSATWTR